jgi:signal transduction histidine kinase/ActR/RegA family two-component response regulator
MSDFLTALRAARESTGAAPARIAQAIGVRWQSVLEDLARTAGVAVVLADADGHPLTATVNERPWFLALRERLARADGCPLCVAPGAVLRCADQARECASDPFVLRDPCGLHHIVVPLVVGDRVEALLFAGRVPEDPVHSAQALRPLLQRVAPGAVGDVIPLLERERPVSREALLSLWRVLHTLGSQLVRPSSGDQPSERVSSGHTLPAAALRGAIAGAWRFDPLNGTAQLSEEWRRIFGRPEVGPHPTSDGWLDAVLPEDRGHVREALRDAFAGWKPFDSEFRIRHPEHGVRWLYQIGRLSPEHQPPTMAGIVIDVTDRKHTDGLVRESQRFLRAVLDSLESHIAVLDQAGTIVEVNAAWRQFANANSYAGAHYGLGDNYLEICEPALGGCDEGGRAAAGIRDVLSERLESYVMEYPCHSPVERRWFTMRVTRFQIDGHARVVVAHDNITPRKLAEEALQIADRRKDEFLATLAHELRNPLAPIQSAVQVMKLLSDGDQQLRGAREVIDRQVTHMTRLVDDLLDVSRITRGKIRLQIEQVDVASVVRRAVETVRPFVDAAHHRLTLSLPVEPLTVEGDPVRLGQVVGNVLHNAAKYTPVGGRLHLNLRREGSAAVIRVQDSGVGISPEMLPRIFDLFVQADGEPERGQTGLGIGLALARRLVELHGGTIEAASGGPGRGTEFTIRLPALGLSAAQSSHSPGDSAEVHGEGPTVLVVDDNVDSATMLATFLGLLGYSVRTAHEGHSALAALAAAPADIAILDIGMPRMDGYELARRLSAGEVPRPRLLVAVSGYGRDEDKRRAAEAGFDEHFVKPVDPEHLHALIQARLRR